MKTSSKPILGLYRVWIEKDNEILSHGVVFLICPEYRSTPAKKYCCQSFMEKGEEIVSYPSTNLWECLKRSRNATPSEYRRLEKRVQHTQKLTIRPIQWPW